MKSDRPPQTLKLLAVTSLAGIVGFLGFIGLGYFSAFFILTDLMPQIIDIDPVAMTPVFDWPTYAVKAIVGIIIFLGVFYVLKLRNFIGSLAIMAVLFLGFYLMPVSSPHRSVVQKMELAHQMNFSPSKSGIYVIEVSFPKSQVEALYNTGADELLTDEPWINLFYQFSLHQPQFDFRILNRLPLNPTAFKPDSKYYNYVLFAGKLCKSSLEMNFDIGFGSNDLKLPHQPFMPSGTIPSYDSGLLDPATEYRLIKGLAGRSTVPPMVKLTSINIENSNVRPTLLITYFDRPISMAIKYEGPEAMRDAFGEFYVLIMALFYSIIGTLIMIAFNSQFGKKEKS